MEEFLFKLEELIYINKFLGIFLSFISGIILSFSPCVYPLIPITLSVIGITAKKFNLRNFKIVFLFILGVATTFTTLGIISSVFGILLNKIFNNFLVYLFLSFLSFIFGLVSFDIIKLNIFFDASKLKMKNFFSIYIFGAFFAFSIIPCNLPVLGTILTLLAYKKDIIYGFILLFSFSLGYTFLVFLAGLFSFFIKGLIKDSFYNIILNRIFGIILFGMSGYFLFKFINLFL